MGFSEIRNPFLTSMIQPSKKNPLHYKYATGFQKMI